MSIIIDNGNPSISNNAGDFSIENTNGNLNVKTTDANPVNIRPNDTIVAEFDNTGITFNTELLVDNPTITIRDTDSSGNVHLWFQDETNTNRGILYWDRTASAMLLQVYNSSGVAQNNIQVRETDTRSTKSYYAPVGSVSAPGYAFTNDTDVGIYRVSSNVFGVATAGSKKLEIFTGQWQGDLHIYPENDNTRTIGTSSFRWAEVWAADGTINTSDEREKTAIADTTLGLDFINELRPVEYKWKECKDVIDPTPDEEDVGSPTPASQVVPRAGVRKHQGLVAQEVKTAMDTLGISTNDFAGYIYEPPSGSPAGSPIDDRYSLRYSEFIPPLIKAIQELKAENDALKARVDALETLHGSPMV